MNYPLKDLAQFSMYEGEREGMIIRCPNCGVPGSVHFKESRYAAGNQHPTWLRTGETLETISLTPSVRFIGHFHSWVKNGELQVDSAFECVAHGLKDDVPEEGKTP